LSLQESKEATTSAGNNMAGFMALLFVHDKFTHFSVGHIIV
jgi:hypothetical protein